MTKTIATLALVMALFGGTVLAGDGNMGNGDYTGCGGTNPPPTCPPANGGNGFANIASDGVDSGSGVGEMTLVFSDSVIDVMSLVY